MSDIQAWFNALPRFTRFWFGLTVLFTLVGRFGLVSAYYLALLYEPLFKQLQIWRPLTALFWYPLSPQTGFHFLINLYFLYNYSLRLETGIFARSPADYLFMLLFNWFCAVVVGLFMNYPMLMDPMVISVLYVWCQHNRDTIVSFWFGTQFKAMYLPWVLMLFNLIIAGGGAMELAGILIGHLYFFMVFKYPQDFGGPALLRTPQFLYNYLPNTSGGMGGFGAPPPRPAGAANQAGGGGAGGGGGVGAAFRNWGTGQRLGRQ